MAVDEERIRELAYQIWQSEGCPSGQHDRHWEMARKLAASGGTGTGTVTQPVASEAPPAGGMPARTRRTRSVPKPVESPAPAEKAAKPKAAAKKPRTTRTPPPGT